MHSNFDFVKTTETTLEFFALRVKIKTLKNLVGFFLHVAIIT